MPALEQALCRSNVWGVFARRVVLPWAIGKQKLQGRVLEIGSGGGAMVARLLQAYPDITMTALDPDPTMVEASRHRLTGYGDRVDAVTGDATRLRFDAETFDVVVSFLMLHHVGAWERALAEAVRVLRPGGVLIGYDLLDTAIARLVHRADHADIRLVSEGDLRRLLIELGMTEVTVRRRFGGLAATFTAQRAPSEVVPWTGNTRVNNIEAVSDVGPAIRKDRK
ncbi:class I SAM-dependent methyltransferase [Arthrobacter sp. H20]|uniref:class I SAM-dependent methyltransferase n=1 Tax=Arthrobacter sp. H20 TaxID=1267981 RepID=UPI000684FDCB|nr:class I SAM-dependent methyltransferase [Arthrobacter sp. H20]